MNYKDPQEYDSNKHNIKIVLDDLSKDQLNDQKSSNAFFKR